MAANGVGKVEEETGEVAADGTIHDGAAAAAAAADGVGINLF